MSARSAAVSGPAGVGRPWWQAAALAGAVVIAVAASSAVAGAFGAPGMAGPLAASAFLALVAPDSPLAAPRAVLGGHLLGAVVAVATGSIGDPLGFMPAAAPGLALLGMLATRTAHPPAAATPVVLLASGVAPAAAVAAALLGAAVVVIVGKSCEALLRTIAAGVATR